MKTNWLRLMAMAFALAVFTVGCGEDHSGDHAMDEATESMEGMEEVADSTAEAMESIDNATEAEEAKDNASEGDGN